MGTVILGWLAVAAALQAPSAVPAVRASGDLASWFGQEDYPAAAWDARQEGSVRFAYDVAPDGHVSGCTILHSSGSRLLDEGTCAIITSRGQFTPARDAQGRPVADRLTAAITWQLPDELPAEPLADISSYLTSADYPAEALQRHLEGEVEFALIVSPEGLPTDCRVTRSSGSHMLDEATCRAMRERARFAPARDAHRQPARGGMLASVLWRIGPDGAGSVGVAHRLRVHAHARANLASYVYNDDYPLAALERGQHGRVTFILHIAPDGRVADCAVIISSHSPLLDRQTCYVMLTRARFTSATDEDGNPAPDRITAAITWRID